MSADPVKKLRALVKRLRAKYPEASVSPAPAWDGTDSILSEFVFSLLLAESNPPQARAAFERFRSEFVDLNELRIALPDEVAELLGEDDPNASERAARIRATLHDIYQREHVMSLAALSEAGKREIRHYLESLNGITPFVIARVKLLHLGGSAVPVDNTLLSRLHKEHALENAATCESAGEWIPKQFEPGQSASLHALFLASLDGIGESDQPKMGKAGKPEKGDKSKPSKSKDPAKGTKRTKAS